MRPQVFLLRAIGASFVIALTFLVCPLALAGELDVMSFNIRFDKGTDGTNNWSYPPDPRKEKVYTTISNFNPDIFGVQEAFDSQVAELSAEYPGYFYVGEQATLDPVNMPGEHSGLFFRSDRFTLLDEGTFWYSETPNTPGTFFPEAAGSSSTRSSSWAKVYDQEENRTIAVMDNHWYSNSAASRELTAPVVRQKVKTLLGGLPLIMMGDFNADEFSNEIQDLVGQNDPSGFQLLDTYREINPAPNSAIDGTTHGWSGATNGVRKDLIFHTSHYAVTAAAIDHTSFGVGSSVSYPSDHFPVTATLRMNNSFSVLPTAETTPSTDGHDSVDDPAIWIDPTNPANSFIIGADKSGNGASGGRLELYNIIDGSGAANASLFRIVGSGKFNNVDLRYGFDLDGETVDLVVASNRTTEELAVFKVDPAGRTLIDVTGSTQTLLDPYGLALHQATDGTLYAFASDRDGDEVHQYELTGDGSGDVDAALVRTITMNGLVEGLVIDDEHGVLYIGEEDAGIYRFDSDPSGGNITVASGVVVDLVGSGTLVADVEGLTLYDDGAGGGYLIASSQGDSAFALYSRQGDNQFITRFTVDDNTALGVDGASNTDGLADASAALGSAFPEGFLIVMDDENPSIGRDNFKLVPWEAVAAIIPGTVRGDMNGDGFVDLADLNPFVQALTNRAAYDQIFPIFNADYLGDVNEDGRFDLGDLSAFRAAVSGGTSAATAAVPEPSTILLLIAGLGLCFRVRSN